MAMTFWDFLYENNILKINFPCHRHFPETESLTMTHEHDTGYEGRDSDYG